MKHLTPLRRFLLPALGTVIMLSLLFGSAYYGGATQAAGTPLVTLPNSAPITGIAAARAIGRHKANDELTVGLVLQLSDPAGQLNLMKSLYRPGSSSYHAWLSPQQFNARFAPSPAVIATAKSFMTSAGLRLIASSSPTLLLASGTTSQVEATFHSSILDYTLADGSRVYANSREVSVPSTLASNIVAVLGLSNIQVNAPRYKPAKQGNRYGAGPRDRASSRHRSLVSITLTTCTNNSRTRARAKHLGCLSSLPTSRAISITIQRPSVFLLHIW